MVVAGTAVANRDCRLIPKPGGGQYTTTGLVSTRQHQFTLDSDGRATIEVAANPAGSWYELQVRDVGVWPLVVEGTSDTGADAAARFARTRPDGGVITTVQVPGPQGPEGPPGRFYVPVYRSATRQPDTPTGGVYNWSAASWVTLPSGWSALPVAASGNKNLWFANALIIPNSALLEVVPIWAGVGEAGATGPAGPQGPQGAQGPAGQRGAQGQQGVKGDKGDTGAQGPTGLRGPAGADGGEGPRGAQGPQGLQGVKGDTGAQGEKGDKGDTGEGVPTGGTTGQVLAKNSGTDYDTHWVNQSGGGGGGTTVTPHNPAAGDTELAGLTIGTDDFVIVDDRSWNNIQLNQWYLDFLNTLSIDFQTGHPARTWEQAGVTYGGLALFASKPSDLDLQHGTYIANQVLTVSTNRWLGVQFDPRTNDAARFRLHFNLGGHNYYLWISNLRAQTSASSLLYFGLPELPAGTRINVQESTDITGQLRAQFDGDLNSDRVTSAITTASQDDKDAIRTGIGASAGVGHLLDDMAVNAPPATTNWRAVRRNGREGGIAFTGLTNPSLGSAAAATYAAPTNIPSTTTVHYILIRIPAAAEANRYQLVCTNFGPDNPLLVSQLTRIGVSKNWAYYVSAPHATSGAVVRLNTTNDAHHVGTTKYSGTLNTQSVLDSIEDFTDSQIELAQTALEITSGGGGGASLSDNTPEALGTAAPGTGTMASRDDHVHPRQTDIATTEIKNAAITNLKINDNAVSAAKIIDGVITPAKLSSALQTGLMRIPSASPAANRVWGTGSSGGPDWIALSAGTDGDVELEELSSYARASIPTTTVNLGALSGLPSLFFMRFSGGGRDETAVILKNELADGLTIQIGRANLSVDVFDHNNGSLGVKRSGAGSVGVKVYKIIARGAAGPPGPQGPKGYTALTATQYAALSPPVTGELYLITGA